MGSRTPLVEELPSIVEAVEWLRKESLAAIPERSERDRLGLVKIAWNVELLLRRDYDFGMAVLSAFLGDRENRGELAESILVTCVLKRERYAEDPRRIDAIRIVDGVDGEALEVECAIFSALPGQLTLN